MSLAITLKRYLLKVTGARGPSFADIARRVGTIAGIPVPSDASDMLVLNLLSQGLVDVVAAAQYTPIDPVRAAATGNVVLTGEQTLDAIAVVNGDRVLLPYQSDPSENGIWVVAPGAWSRAADFDDSSEVRKGALVNVLEGVAARGSWALVTDDPITVGTTDLTWRPFTIRDITRADLQADNGAGIVYFKADADAVARSVLSRLNDEIHVANYLPVGFVTDGSVDYTAAIKRAITRAAGKKLVFLPIEYKISDLLIFSGLDVDFAGCTFTYTGPVGRFAILLHSDAGVGTNQTVGNKFKGGFTLRQTDFSPLATFTGSATVDPPSIAAGAAISSITPGGYTTTVSVPGARPGGFCTATFSTIAEGVIPTPRCLANDVVTVTFSNYNGGAIDMASGTLSGTCVNNAYHGVCISGVLGYFDPIKVIGFTGVSFAEGDGTDPISGVALPGLSRAYDWNGEVNISPAAGFGFVRPPRNNENRIGISMFAANYWGDGPTGRRNSCIHAVAVAGLNNGFPRFDVEVSPSGYSAYFYGGANNCTMVGTPAYFEYNTAWQAAGSPAVFADITTSQIQFPFRLARVGSRLRTDHGTGNDITAVPTFYINTSQEGSASRGRSLVYNGYFAGKLTGWSDFSTGGCTISYPSAGRFGGNILRVDVPAGGRPNITQNLDVSSGVGITGLRAETLTAMIKVKTNIPGLTPRLAGLTGGTAVGDQTFETVIATIRVAEGASSVPLAIITPGVVAAGGYLEVELVTAAFGNKAIFLPERSVLTGSAAWSVGTLAAGARATTTIAVPGAAFGDFVEASLRAGQQGADLRRYFSAAEVLTVELVNDTAGSIPFGNTNVDYSWRKRG